MRKLTEKLKIETDSRVYKSLRNKKYLRCPLCPANKGCNSKWKARHSRTWKKHRKKQYR